ncbi:DNA-directed DNA polymerase gamma MIP1 [Rhodotorula paludigena]|uniref:DNA-directed DNA polymerase gamma MIP1 n=1 Tax=Rhodotorula paludigena TaxID=86838 RepID=UPI003172DA39
MHPRTSTRRLWEGRVEQSAGPATDGRLTGEHEDLRNVERLHPGEGWTRTDCRNKPAHCDPPLNDVQVPLISPNLRAQLFPPPSSPFAPPAPSQDAIDISIAHLRHHKLLPEPGAPAKKLAPAVEFDLPRLQGPTISHHFHALGRDVAEPYLSMAKSFARAEVPPMPEREHWVRAPGWTFYSADGSFESVDFPAQDDDTLIFDVETMPYAGGHYPVMAVAAGTKGWYAWCSPWLTGDDERPNHLIPFGPPESASTPPDPSSPDFAARSRLFERSDTPPRLLIGHNVLYDRARVANEYSLRRPSTRYIDTLSLHVAVSGLTNPQRPTWIKYRKDRDLAEEEAAKESAEKADEAAEAEAVKSLLSKAKSRGKGKRTAAGDAAVKDWKEVSSLNSLGEVARLHCGIKVDKSFRDVLIDPSVTIEDARDYFDDLIAYCARDVDTTLQVYRALLPKFLESCPHPVTFAGVALMSQPVLPVDRKWPEYLERAERIYQERLAGVRTALHALAEEARAKFDQRTDDGRFVWEDDMWLRQLDWSPKKARRLPGKAAAAKRRLSKKLAEAEEQAEQAHEDESSPAWLAALDKLSLASPLVPLLLETTWRGFPVVFTHSHGWLYAVPTAQVKARAKKSRFEPEEGEELVAPADLGPKDSLVAALPKVSLFTVATRRGSTKTSTLVSTQLGKKLRDGILASPHPAFETAVKLGKAGESSDEARAVLDEVRDRAIQAAALAPEDRQGNIWLEQLDWTPVRSKASSKPRTDVTEVSAVLADAGADVGEDFKSSDLVWPKWYWDLDVPREGLDVSIGKRAAPLLLKLRWKSFPVAYSKEHGWMYRIPVDEFDAALASDPSLKPLSFSDVADASLDADGEGAYVKLPHPDGEGKNVGSPLSKPFVSAFEDGILTSEFPAAEAALSLNASCSYWTSARERITNQMVVWEGQAATPAPTAEAIASSAVSEDTRGLILPQVVPMGTITRRAVERTWLTASNAKKNRVGSELKSMVRAPPGYAIVGADVDSEELWICSVMGDAQFGIHGATAIGWMTLEGTKSAGTDLHSKSASILGISRDDAKVFNYSRIYGAGVKHAVQLLLKSNPALSIDQATELAKALYASTKGVVDRSPAFRRNFWHGGTESFVFNKLEEIAQSERPRTPALGCGLTSALTKAYLPADRKSKAGEGYLPSRINWVVQSSGVDYLHLLIVSMEYLTRRFEIDARYLISVHDEVRYLVKEEDKDRAAMALQVANLWTRSLFAYRLQMPDLPQGCAFFSAVDADSCFRKEVNMTCVTPSNPDSIPFGESLEISDSLARTSGGSLFADGRSMATHEAQLPLLPPPTDLSDAEVMGEQHRVHETHFLVAQTASKASEITRLWRELQEQTRLSKMGFSRDAASIAAAAESRNRRKTTATVDAEEPKRKVSVRFEDDPELLPRPVSAPAASTRSRAMKATASRPRRSSKAAASKDDDGFFDDDEALPDEAEDQFSAFHPVSRAQV